MNEIVKKKKDLRKKLTEKRILINKNTTLDFNEDAFYKLTKKIELKNKPNVDTRSFTLYSLKKLEGKKVGK